MTQLLRVRQCELEARRVSPRPVSGLQAPRAYSVPPVISLVPHPPSTGEFDISRQIRLVLLLGKLRLILTSVRLSV